VVQCGAVWCSVVQCGAVRFSVVQCGSVWCSAVQCGAVCCSVVQCGSVWCSAVQCGAVRCTRTVATLFTLDHVASHLFREASHQIIGLFGEYDSLL